MYGGAGEKDSGTGESLDQPSSLLPCRGCSMRALRGISACHFKCWGSRGSPDLPPQGCDLQCTLAYCLFHTPAGNRCWVLAGICQARGSVCAAFSSPVLQVVECPAPCLSLPAGISATLSFTPPSTRFPRLTNMSLTPPFMSLLILAHNAQCVTSAED